MVGSTANYGSDLFARFQIRTPLKRYTGFTRVNFDVNDNLTLFAEGALGYSANFGGQATTTQVNDYIVSRDNPFLPAATRNAMIANNLTTITVGRFNDDIGRWRIDSDFTAKRLVLGAKGKVFGDWSWEASYQTSRNLEHWNVQNMQHIANQLAAMWVVTGPNGQPVCGPIATNPNLTAARRLQVQSPCVPFNMFGSGRGTPEAYAYISGHTYLGRSPSRTWRRSASLARRSNFRPARSPSRRVQNGARTALIRSATLCPTPPRRGASTTRRASPARTR